MDRITETDQDIIRTVEVILEEEICDQIRIIEVKVVEVDIEENYRNDDYERGRSRPRHRQYSDNTRRNDRSNSRSR